MRSGQADEAVPPCTPPGRRWDNLLKHQIVWHLLSLVGKGAKSGQKQPDCLNVCTKPGIVNYCFLKYITQERNN